MRVAIDAAELLGAQEEREDGGKVDPDFVMLRQRIINRWRAEVDEELADHPVNDTDWAFAALPEKSRAELTANPRLAYGTTLVAALVTPAFGLFLQLGDGDILLLYDAPDGTVEVVRPVPPDPRSFANETASLSAPPPADGELLAKGDALWEEIRVRRLPFHRNRLTLAMVLVTTDGFPNAFASDGDFDDAAVALLRQYRAAGRNVFQKQLGGMLQAATTQGSGDDVTVAFAFRRTASTDDTAMLPEAGQKIED